MGWKVNRSELSNGKRTQSAVNAVRNAGDELDVIPRQHACSKYRWSDPVAKQPSGARPRIEPVGQPSGAVKRNASENDASGKSDESVFDIITPTASDEVVRRSESRNGRPIWEHLLVSVLNRVRHAARRRKLFEEC